MKICHAKFNLKLENMVYLKIHHFKLNSELENTGKHGISEDTPLFGEGVHGYCGEILLS